MYQYSVINLYNIVQKSADFEAALQAIKKDSATFKRILACAGEIIYGQGHWLTYESFKKLTLQDISYAKLEKRIIFGLQPENLHNLSIHSLRAVAKQVIPFDIETVAGILKVEISNLQSRVKRLYKISCKELCELSDTDCHKKFSSLMAVPFGKENRNKRTLNSPTQKQPVKIIKLNNITIQDFYAAAKNYRKIPQELIYKSINLNRSQYYRAFRIIGGKPNYLQEEFLSNQHFATDTRRIDLTETDIKTYSLLQIHSMILETAEFYRQRNPIDPYMPEYMVAANLNVEFSKLNTTLKNLHTSIEQLKNLNPTQASQIFPNYSVAIGAQSTASSSTHTMLNVLGWQKPNLPANKDMSANNAEVTLDIDEFLENFSDEELNETELSSLGRRVY